MKKLKKFLLLSCSLLLLADYANGATITKSKRHKTDYTTNWNADSEDEYSVTASASGVSFNTDKTTATGGAELTNNSSSSATAKKTITHTEYPNTAEFPIGVAGVLTNSDSGSSITLGWSADLKQQFFWLKPKEITTTVGVPVTITAKGYKPTSTWTIKGQSWKDHTTSGSNPYETTSITLNRDMWDKLKLTPEPVPENFKAPTKGTYTIMAETVDDTHRTASAIIEVVDPSDLIIYGHGKTSAVPEEIPEDYDPDQNKIYTAPYTLVTLNAQLYGEPVDANWSTGGSYLRASASSSGSTSVTEQNQVYFKVLETGSYIVNVTFTKDDIDYEAYITINSQAPKVLDISFNSDISIKRDKDESTYTKPQWRDNDYDGAIEGTEKFTEDKDRQFSVAYISTKKLKIAKANTKLIVVDEVKSREENKVVYKTITYDAEPSNIKYKASFYVGSQKFEMEKSADADNKFSVSNLDATKPFKSAAEVDYLSSFKINWQASFNNTNKWHNMNSTSNELYLTLKDGGSSAFETVLHIGCKNAKGQTKEAAIVNAIWNQYFAKQYVKSKYGTNSLTYWGPLASNITGAYERGLASLLKNQDGRCGEWAVFMISSCNIQGISSLSQVVYDKSSSGIGFLVKPWAFAGTGTSGDSNFPYKYGEFNQLNNLGKGNPSSVGWFSDHVIVKYAGKLYDPSYGTNATSNGNYQENAIDGWFKGLRQLNASPTEIKHLAPEKATNDAAKFLL